MFPFPPFARSAGALVIERDHTDCSILMMANVQLPKKDRALCLFNPAILSVKITDALAILSLSADADDTPSQSPAVAPAAINGSSSPKKPTPTSSLSLAQLAALPLPEFLAQLDASVLDGLGVTKPTAEKKKETEVFMDGLEGRGVNEVRLFGLASFSFLFFPHPFLRLL